MLLSTREEGPPKIDRDITPLLTEFLTCIFRKNAKDRPSAEELLSHPFLTADDLDDSMGTIGPGGLSRPYRSSSEGGSGSSADLLRLKEIGSPVK
jgi:hypothetical protein